jgi:hypothetical protein
LLYRTGQRKGNPKKLATVCTLPECRLFLTSPSFPYLGTDALPGMKGPTKRGILHASKVLRTKEGSHKISDLAGLLRLSGVLFEPFMTHTTFAPSL